MATARPDGKEVRLVSLVPGTAGSVGFKCSASSASDHGMVESVDVGGPADAGKHGLFEGDVIVKIGGVDATRLSGVALRQLLRSHSHRVRLGPIQSLGGFARAGMMLSVRPTG